MLTLADASSYFDRTPVYDGYTGALLFNAQIDPYDDSKRDSATAYRRVLSVAPGTAMPAGKVILALGARWIVGDGEQDALEEAHREKYVLHPARGLYSHGTLADYLAGTAARQVYGDLEWVKDSRATETSSRPAPLYNMYMSSTVPVGERQVLWNASQAMITTAVRPQPSGVKAALGELLDYQVVQASLQSRTYNPATGGITAGSSVQRPCLRVRWQALYDYNSQADAKYQEGDCNLVFAVGTSITTASAITLAGEVWGVLSVETLAGALVVHARLK